MAKMDEERQYKKKKEQEEQELREAFMSREIQPEAIDRINNAVASLQRMATTGCRL